MFTLITAIAKNNVIGLNNGLPWCQLNDLQRFKAITYGHPVIMGKKTFESMRSKPLPDRRNHIVTRNPEAFATEYLKSNKAVDFNVNTFEEIFSFYKGSHEEIFIIGGQQIYELFLPFASKIILTELNGTVIGDAYFPEFDRAEWKIVSTESYQQSFGNDYDYKFITLVRK